MACSCLATGVDIVVVFEFVTASWFSGILNLMSCCFGSIV
jgi:hypothetical protein